MFLGALTAQQRTPQHTKLPSTVSRAVVPEPPEVVWAGERVLQGYLAHKPP